MIAPRQCQDLLGLRLDRDLIPAPDDRGRTNLHTFSPGWMIVVLHCPRA
jgi:hypothetical protein